MILSAGSIIARASSGSRSRINSVEPLISANSAVTVLRSPSIVRAASGRSAATRASEADSGADAVAPTETALSISGAPHLPQKLEDGGFSALHFAHDLVRTFPHCAQKLLPGVLFVPHFVQRTGVPPTAEWPFCIIERREVTAAPARARHSNMRALASPAPLDSPLNCSCHPGPASDASRVQGSTRSDSAEV